MSTARITTRLPTSWFKKLDKLVEDGAYLSRSDAIRDAVRRFLKGV